MSRDHWGGDFIFNQTYYFYSYCFTGAVVKVEENVTSQHNFPCSVRNMSAVFTNKHYGVSPDYRKTLYQAKWIQ